MRILNLNGVNVDIDDQTAIGITFQCYDVKEPGKRKTKVSNSFTIPKSAKNMKAIGFAGNPYSNDTTIYDYIPCSYYIDNDIVINNGKASVQSISDRIELIIVEKNSIWDDLKEFTWSDFIDEFISWLQTEKGLPSITNIQTGSDLKAFLEQYAIVDNSNHVILALYASQFYTNEVELDGSTFYLDHDRYNTIKYYSKAPTQFNYGGRFSIYAKSVFEFLEYKYGVNFYTSTAISFNIWSDPYASKIFIPFRELDLKIATDGSYNPVGFYFKRAILLEDQIANGGTFAPFDDVNDKRDKTLYDFVNAFFQHFNIIINDDGLGNIRLSRFDDIKNNAPIVDFSDRIESDYTFKPTIDGYGIKSTIKFKAVFDGGDELYNGKTIISSNKTLNGEEDLFEIDAFAAGFVQYYTDLLVNLGEKESFKTFEFLISESTSTANWYIKDKAGIIKTVELESGDMTTPLAQLYALSNEYNLIEEIANLPKFYEIKKWLTFNDIRTLDFFSLFYIKQLGGAFFINKISDFNPQKALEATTLEMIFVTDKSPFIPPDLDYFTDGVGDAFTDGNGDYFI